ncbi:CAP domain-containing protein [Obelidium mucronatum]|nr:CAP domain-containing protein [Obelidium mucronatum]
MTAQEEQDIVAIHNNFRAQNGVSQPVSWDRGIAQQAADWANYLASYQCSLQHGGTNGLGQNLAMQAGGDASMQALFSGWASECLDCGLNHATQAAWASTTSIGCATAWGSWGGMSCVVLVCDYYPPGNWGGVSWRTG